MIGIGYCTKQSDEKIDDLDYINNMLMLGNSKYLLIFSYYCRLTPMSYILGQENKENDSWGCGYHGDDGYSFCSGSGGLYDLSDSPGYTTGDVVGCYLNFKNKIVFYTKNGINLGN